MAKNNCSTPPAVNTTPDAFSIPSLKILLPNKQTIEVSYITHRCISIFNHSTGEITQARGDLALIAFLRGLLLPAPVLIADVKVAAQSCEREHRIAVKDGEYSHEVTLADAVREWVKKHHRQPNLIVMAPNPVIGTVIDEYAGIEIEYRASCPARAIWIGERV